MFGLYYLRVEAWKVVEQGGVGGGRSGGRGKAGGVLQIVVIFQVCILRSELGLYCLKY